MTSERAAARGEPPEDAVEIDGAELKRLWRIERAARRWRGAFDEAGYGVLLHNDYEGNAAKLMEAIDGRPLRAALATPTTPEPKEKKA